MADIELQHVHKQYGTAHVLNDINLHLGAGEFCVFIGPSGCGKSTLLRMIAGLEDISSGTLSIDGKVVNDVPPAKRNVAMVFQSYALYPHMNVFDNMAFGLKVQKLDSAEIDRRVREASRVLQLDRLLERKPKALSGGQRQRVAIGRAIVRKPKVFLFDEPLSNLDAALRVQTRIEIARLHKQIGGTTMVYVTHDQVEAMTLADKIVLLNTGAAVARDGSIAQVGSPLELYHTPANRFVAGFIGSPGMNFLAASVTSIAPNGVTVVLRNGVSLRAAVAGNALNPGAQVTYGIRPEHLTIHADGDLVGRVSHVEHMGEHSYVYLKLADLDGGEADQLVVKHPGTFSDSVGATVRVAVPANEAHLFDRNERACSRLFVDLKRPAGARVAVN